MTDQTIKRKCGRPPLPPAPQNAAETRQLIAAEVVKTNPRERTLRHLRLLLRAFERAEVQAAADLKNKLLAEQVRLAEAANTLKADEYRRRRELGIARRKETTVRVIDCGTVPTLTGRAGERA